MKFDSTTGNGVYGHVSTAASSGVYGRNDGTGYGVSGRANNGTGVFGDSTNGIGVSGQGGENGVQAEGGAFGVFATGSDYGVYASGPAHGVFGQATGAGGAGGWMQRRAGAAWRSGSRARPSSAAVGR